VQTEEVMTSRNKPEDYDERYTGKGLEVHDYGLFEEAD
jgi:hypothetical protein